MPPPQSRTKANTCLKPSLPPASMPWYLQEITGVPLKFQPGKHYFCPTHPPLPITLRSRRNTRAGTCRWPACGSEPKAKHAPSLHPLWKNMIPAPPSVKPHKTCCFRLADSGDPALPASLLGISFSCRPYKLCWENKAPSRVGSNGCSLERLDPWLLST